MSKNWNKNYIGRSRSRDLPRNNHNKRNSNNNRNFINKSYKIYPQLDDRTFYVYHYDIGFGATFKSLSDIRKFLDYCY